MKVYNYIENKTDTVLNLTKELADAGIDDFFSLVRFDYWKNSFLVVLECEHGTKAVCFGGGKVV